MMKTFCEHTCDVSAPALLHEFVSLCLSLFGNAVARSLSLYVSLTWYFPLGYSLPCLWACEMSQSEEKAPPSLWKPLARLYENVLKGRRFQGRAKNWQWTEYVSIGLPFFVFFNLLLASKQWCSISCDIVLRFFGSQRCFQFKYSNLAPSCKRQWLLWIY